MPKNIVGSRESEYRTQITVNGMPVGIDFENQRVARLIIAWLESAVDQIELATTTRGYSELRTDDARDRKDQSLTV